MRDYTAVVLTGGAGKRLRPLTNTRPKPMLEVKGKPILEHIVGLFKKHGFRKFIFCNGYKAEIIEGYFGDGSRFGVSIEHSLEKEPLGSGGAVKMCAHKIKGPFFVANGDIVTDIDLKKLVDFHEQMKDAKGTIGTLSLARLKCRYGVVDFEGNIITGFREKPYLNTYINAGFFVFEQDMLKLLPEKGSTEMETLPDLAREGKLAAFTHEGYWRSIDSQKDLEEVDKGDWKI